MTYAQSTAVDPLVLQGRQDRKVHENAAAVERNVHQVTSSERRGNPQARCDGHPKSQRTCRCGLPQTHAHQTRQNDKDSGEKRNRSECRKDRKRPPRKFVIFLRGPGFPVSFKLRFSQKIGQVGV